MTVSGVSSSSSSSGGIASDTSTIAGNFDTFLSLLTTQLQNQDPLDPLDTNEFTSQLVQFSSVEQQLKTNSYLQNLVQSTQNSQNNAAVSYIGKQVTSSGVDADLKNGAATWNFNLPQAANVTVTIKDSSGNQVYTENACARLGRRRLQLGRHGDRRHDGSRRHLFDLDRRPDLDRRLCGRVDPEHGYRHRRRPHGHPARADRQRPEHQPLRHHLGHHVLVVAPRRNCRQARSNASRSLPSGRFRPDSRAEPGFLAFRPWRDAEPSGLAKALRSQAKFLTTCNLLLSQILSALS